MGPAEDVKIATAQHTAVGRVVQTPDRRAREVRTTLLRHSPLNTHTTDRGDDIVHSTYSVLHREYAYIK